MSCVNKNLQEVKDIAGELNISPAIAAIKIGKWQADNTEDRFPTVEELKSKKNEANYQLKAVDILASNKAEQMFAKGKKNGWDLNKILTELAIPKAQKQIILDKNINDREEILTSLLAENSFVVEVNTSTETANGNNRIDGYNNDNFDSNSAFIEEDDFGGYIIKDKNGEMLTPYIYNTKKEAQNIIEGLGNKPSQYYSNLTVPGGTNYTENEVSTPAITPNIKGHGQFSTDNGIGWFRSDDQVLNGVSQEYIEGDEAFVELDENFMPISRPQNVKQEGGTFGGQITKTRRILEVQSDLFQKGRDKGDLVNGKKVTNLNTQENDIFGTEEFKFEYENSIYESKVEMKYYPEENQSEPEEVYYKNKKEIEVIEFTKAFKEKSNKESVSNNDNQFLQLLNKKGNWVNFFIESIVQDSAKKGYKKVLFPTGETAAKVEGHETIANDIIKTDKALLILKNSKVIKSENNKGFNIKDSTRLYGFYDTIQEAKNSLNTQIEKLKNKKEELKTQGLEKLKPVEAFYTNKVTNILNKKYKGRVKEITDEHGNTWNEIDLKLEDANQSFILQLNTQQSKKDANKSYESIVEEDAVTEYDANKSKETVAKDRTDILQALFNGRMSPVSANEFLKSLKSNTSLNLSTEALNLIDSMLASRAKIKFVSSAALENGKDTYAQYNTTGRVILINRDVLGEGNVYFAIESILHEIVHDMTVNAYNNPTTDKRAAFKNEVDELYRRALANNPNVDPTGTYYGLTSAEEFIAEIMTNKAFRDALTEDDRSIFTKLIDAIKTLLGITTNEINKELVDSLMESILDVSKTEYNVNEVSPLHKSYELNTRDKIYESVSDVDNDLKNKLANLNSEINKMKDRLESAKDGYKRKNNKNKTKSVQSLIDIIEKKQEKEALKSVVAYINFALTEMETIEESLGDSKYYSNIDKMGGVFRSINLYSDTKGLINTLNYMKKNDLITEGDYDAISDKVNILSGVVNNVTDISLNLAKDILAKQMAPYNVEIKVKYENQYRKEAREKGLKGNAIAEYVVEQLNENKDIINADKYSSVRASLNTTFKDISSAAYKVLTEFSIDSTVINITSTLIMEVEKDIRNRQLELRNEMNSFLSNNSILKSSASDKSRYDFMLDETNNGYYYVTKYKSQFNETLNELKDKRSNAKTKEEREKANSEFSKWRASNTTSITIAGKLIYSPTDKWLNPKFKALSGDKLKFYNKMMEFVSRADEFAHGYKSLTEQPFKNNSDVKFTRLQGITRTNKDKLIAGEFKNALIDSAGDLVKIREDSTEQGNTLTSTTDINNKSVNTVPLYFRGAIAKKSNQSLDIPTMVVMDAQSSFNYSKMYELDNNMTVITEVIESTTFNKVENGKKYVSALKKLISGYDVSEEELIKIAGKDSNTYKKLKSIIENRVYNITDIYAGQLFGTKLSINQLSNTISAYTANLQLGLNYLSAIPNVTQAVIQNRIEAMGGDVFDNKALNSATKEYWANIGGILSDIESFTSQSKVNMVMDIYDTSGEFKGIKKAFQDSNKLRGLASTSTMHVLNAMGEHYAQSVMTMAMLKKVKAKNAKGQFINQEGKVVTEKEAMTLYDAYEKVKNKKTGLYELKINKHVDHTSFTTDKFSEIGEVQHISLIKNTVEKVHGQYDKKFQNDLQRHWWGKLIFMFKKWMVGSYTRRWRGFSYVREDFNELTREQKYFNFSKQDFDEGTYSTFARFIGKVIIPAISFQKQASIAKGYNNLTDMEKGNLRRVATELTYMTVVTLGAMLLGANADDDDDTLLFLAFLFKRQSVELQQYYSPTDTLRVLKSPAVSVNVIQKQLDLLSQLIGFDYDEGFNATFNDKYEAGKNKEDYKAYIKFIRTLPIISRTQASAKQQLEYLELL